MLEKMGAGPVEVDRQTEKWSQELQHNKMRMEFYRALLKSSFGKLTPLKVENTSHIFFQLQQLKQRHRKLCRALLELQNRRGRFSL